MGPRSSDRGNDVTDIIEHNKCIALQWGRDHLIAEMEEMRKGSAPATEASMGPRSSDRGNMQQRSVEQLRSSIASMGPRSSDRGNVNAQHGYLHVREGLQWGRDHLIAEMKRDSEVYAARIKLQWGRDHLIAEIWPASSMRFMLSQCFNGAAII